MITLFNYLYYWRDTDKINLMQLGKVAIYNWSGPYMILETIKSPNFFVWLMLPVMIVVIDFFRCR
jgi:hypothetical protein